MRQLKLLFKKAKSLGYISVPLSNRLVSGTDQINALPPKIDSVDITELFSYPYSLVDMVQRKTDGVIVRSVLSQREIEVLKNEIVAFSSSDMPEVRKGYYTFPKTCFDESYKENWTPYFENQHIVEEHLNSIISINIEAKVNPILKKLSGDLPIASLYGNKKGQHFLSGNYRLMTEDVGDKATSNIHNGHELYRRCKDSVMKHVINDIDFFYQLSYFLVIGKPEIGGNLSLYHYRWPYVYSYNDEYTAVLNESRDRTVTLPSANKTTVKINEGDLIVFSGGHIFHRVEPVKGPIPRVTYGGFINADKQHKRLFKWI